jgi:hypothetical protein
MERDECEREAARISVFDAESAPWFGGKDRPQQLDDTADQEQSVGQRGRFIRDNDYVNDRLRHPLEEMRRQIDPLQVRVARVRHSH